MRALSDYQVWYGANNPPPETRELRAGPVAALLDGIDLRYIRRGPLEVVRRVYVAVRDQNWNTILGQHRITRIDQRKDGFEVEFDVEHRAPGLDFAWHGSITGMPDGQIRYVMDGAAGSEFRYNRVGFCILHPYRECAGKPYRARTPGGEVSGTLPDEIGPQRFEHGVYVPLFPSFSNLVIDIDEGVQARLDFEGDLFEMEDQRNWTDASFKTYCTPLSRGFPHTARPGSRIWQSFTVRIVGGAGRRERTPETPLPRLSLGKLAARPLLPTIGFSLNSDGAPLTGRELERVRVLRPDHLRLDLHLHEDYAARLKTASAICQELGCKLEIALFLTGEMTGQLERLASALSKGPPVARFLVLQEGSQTAHPSETTAPELVALARRCLHEAAPGSLFAGGTDMYFCELNRTRPQVASMDGIFYTIIPQAHAFDNRSLAETLEAQGETVRSARAFAGGRPVIVSPVTLKRRYNPHATVAEAEKAPNELPDAVDPRQMSLFGAAWTAGSIKYLAESGAASLTYYELTGWRGIMERETGSPLPELFPSLPETVFPLYHVFADIAEWKGGALATCTASQPLVATALAVAIGGELHLLVVNFTAGQQRVVIDSLPAGQAALRSMDASNALEAMQHPEVFRLRREMVDVDGGELALDLAPYAIVRIDV
ncbi:MAG TPA: hypothetical protein VKV40_12295 [Ktedonobacteraceae bacterium]|nr:hypothetical protein [Ktedonobacteraceae bacterium]